MIEVQQTTNSQEAGAELLLDTVNPLLYRTNAFRVSGLSVEATPRDINKKIQMFKILEMRSDGAAQTTGPLPLEPAPALDDIREVIQGLSDPEHRLVDEFFWFWPSETGQASSDEALTLLAKGHVEAAAKLWRLREQLQSVSNVSAHNLAILAHAEALDLEFKARSGQLSEQEKERLQDAWSAAFKRWQLLLKDEGFWSRLRRRIKAFDDPRLQTGAARRMQRGLPLALMLINAQLMLDAAERGDQETVDRQRALMQASGIEESTVLEALKITTKPTRGRIKDLCKDATVENDKDPEKGGAIAERVLARAQPMLAIIDTLLSESHPTREVVHDEVAMCVLQCGIDYGNKMDNWETGLGIFEQALLVAARPSMRERVEDNIRIATSNVEYYKLHGQCWFCKSNPASENAKIEIEMHGDVRRVEIDYSRYQIRWNHATITVPRCQKCNDLHNRAGWVMGSLITLGVLGGIGVWVLLESELGFALGLCMAIALFVAAFLQRRKILEGTEGFSHRNEFPRIKELLAEGWTWGKKPPTENQ